MTRAADGTFEWKGYNLAYSDFGSGDRVLVLMHGLLMNRHMFDRIAPEMASRGYRVITIDVLGHGASDRPEDMRLYNMPAFGDQIAALIDHLELDRPVVGGTSLGANAALEFGYAHAGKARALLVEMPVLDNALLGAALAFTPVLLALRFGQPILQARSRRSFAMCPARASSSTSGSTGSARIPALRAPSWRGSSFTAPRRPMTSACGSQSPRS